MNKRAFSSPTFVIKYVVISKETVSYAHDCCPQGKKNRKNPRKQSTPAKERKRVREKNNSVVFVYLKPLRYPSTAHGCYTCIY